MSISSVADADYATVIGYCRDHLSNGTRISADESRLVLAVVKDAIARITTGNAAQEAVRTSLTNIRTALVALDATACAAASGATAAAIIVTQCAAIATAKAAVLTGEIALPTYSTSTVADG